MLVKLFITFFGLKSEVFNVASKFLAIKCLLLRILIQSVEIFKTEKKIEIQLHDVQHIA